VVEVPRADAPQIRAGIEALRRSSIAAKYEQVSTTKSPARSCKQRPRDFNHGLLNFNAPGKKTFVCPGLRV
jgi:hypothetical protein